MLPVPFILTHLKTFITEKSRKQCCGIAVINIRQNCFAGSCIPGPVLQVDGDVRGGVKETGVSQSSQGLAGLWGCSFRSLI